MVTINKSFVYGTCFASLTWLISLYLYWQLTKSDDLSGSSRQFSYSKNDANDQETGYRDQGQIFRGINYVNSDKLRKQLQPILPNSSSNSSLVEQGMLEQTAYRVNLRTQNLDHNQFQDHQQNLQLLNVPDKKYNRFEKFFILFMCSMSSKVQMLYRQLK